MIEKFETINGLAGINRDVFIRLARHFQKFDNCDDKIREILGIGEEFYIWKDSSYFTWMRNKIEYPLRTVQNQNEKSYVIAGSQIDFLRTYGEFHTILLLPLLKTGVNRCIVQVTDRKKWETGIYIGVSAESISEEIQNDFIGHIPGSVSYGGHSGLSWINLGGRNSGQLSEKFHLRQGDILTAEVSLSTSVRTLRFMRNDSPLPHTVTDVPTDIFFGLYGSKWGNTSMEFLGLQRLPVQSIPPVPAHEGVSYAWV